MRIKEIKRYSTSFKNREIKLDISNFIRAITNDKSIDAFYIYSDNFSSEENKDIYVNYESSNKFFNILSEEAGLENYTHYLIIFEPIRTCTDGYFVIASITSGYNVQELIDEILKTDTWRSDRLKVSILKECEGIPSYF